jgi:hypothetical protein
VCSALGRRGFALFSLVALLSQLPFQRLARLSRCGSTGLHGSLQLAAPLAYRFAGSPESFFDLLACLVKNLLGSLAHILRELRGGLARSPRPAPYATAQLGTALGR